MPYDTNAKLQEQVDTLRVLLNDATKLLLNAKRSVISEYSSDSTTDLLRASVEINEIRLNGGLEALPLADFEVYPGQLTELVREVPWTTSPRK